MHLRETTDLSQRSQELGTNTCSKILQSKRSLPSDFKETRSNRESRKDQYEVSNITTKGDMEGQQNPNEPGKSGTPGQQGGQQQDRERQERERQQREREKQGGQQGGGGGQQGGQQSGR